MKISSIFLFCAFGIAFVYARFTGAKFGGSKFGGSKFGGSFGHRSTHAFGSAFGGVKSFGHKPSVGFAIETSKGGVPCQNDGTCAGHHEECVDYLNTKLCFVKKELHESCSGRFDLCKNSVCRLDEGHKKCVADDNKADVGEICGTDRPCLGDNECKPCAWKRDESRCVKMSAEGEECGLFNMCEAPGVCEKSALTKKATCKPCSLVCPPCHKPNDACDACELNPDEAYNCDPCGFDANGRNGHAICANLTGVHESKCCSPYSDCTKGTSGAIDYFLPSTVTWSPSTFICSKYCDDESSYHCLNPEANTCTPFEPIPLPYDGYENTIEKVPTCDCQLVCPACHIPNDTCDGCVIDEAAPTSCDPCADYDANGDDGDARCKAMNQGYCCMSDSACTSMSGILNGRLNYLLDPKTFICSDSCNSGNCDESGQKLCTVGPPIPLSYDAGDVVAEVPTCKCELVCPPCHKPDTECNYCVFDWTAPENCNPCEDDAEGFSGDARCAGALGSYMINCCPPTSECTKVGGRIDYRTDDAHNPSTFICARDCGTECDLQTGTLCHLFGSDISLKADASYTLVTDIYSCGGGP